MALTISMTVLLSIMYQVYFFEFNDGEIIGGESQRFYLKTVFSFLLYCSIKNFISWAPISINIFYKIPLLYVSFTIFVLTPFLTGTYIQALNIFFFLPIFFIDWNRFGGADLYGRIWKIILTIVAIQLLLHPVFKSYFNAGWDNGALIGGMGNPNVFGIFLIISGLASLILLSSHFKYLSTLLFFSTVFTGSLVSSIIGVGLILVQVSYSLCSSPMRTMFLMGLIFTPLSIFVLNIEFIANSMSIVHALNKAIALKQMISGDFESGSDSISVRLDYLQGGINMIADSPLSLFVGHPDFMPMYNGDGLWVSYIVTYGFPVAIYFLFVNLLVCYRGIMSRSPDLQFSGLVIIVMLVFFITNRILDYWPAALIYMLAFTYLTNKGVRRIKRVSQV